MSEERKAYFAGGCFWCVEEAFENAKGVSEVLSGYAGGHVKNPTYEQVTYQNTGHFEAVEVRYDPKIISYNELLNIFWKNIDPYNNDGQFCDIGSSYRSAIFYQNDEELKAIEASKKTLTKVDVSKFKTDIKKFENFYLAEEYHQDFYKKNPIRYKMYKNGCGREKTLRKIWG